MSDFESDDEYDWEAPMDEEMKHTFAIIEKLHPKFAMKNWNQVATATGMSLGTAKQRFARLRDKYLAEMPALQACQENQVDSTRSNDDKGEEASAPSTTAPLNRGKTRAAPWDEDDVEDDGDNVPSEPPAGQRGRIRRSARISSVKPSTFTEPHHGEEQHPGNEKVERFPFNPKYEDPKPWIFPNLKRPGEHQEDPTLANPFAKPPKNEKGRTPLPSQGLMQRRKDAQRPSQREGEQDEEEQDRDEEDQD
ncbi:hypothetical protein PG991_010807 [Apiospora marii]|uniref:Myb-like domain-containing protein n=1 Tax=Apiospora marii TaxID=335849 RepID=A0ABR1RCI7_9PEZI